jgi:hypothetical protein
MYIIRVLPFWGEKLVQVQYKSCIWVKFGWS